MSKKWKYVFIIGNYFIGFVLNILILPLIEFFTSYWIYFYIPIGLSCFYIGFILPRRGYLHGFILSFLQLIVHLYILISMTYLNTKGNYFILPGHEKLLFRSSTIYLLLGVIGGYLGSYSRLVIGGAIKKSQS